MEAGETLDLGVLGIQVQVRVSDETQLQYDVIGRPCGLLGQEHVHSYQRERFEVLSGAMKLVLGGSEHELGPGQVMEVPPGAAHRQLAAGVGVGQVRVTVTPPGRTLEFMRRLAELARDGRLLRNGLPRPLAVRRRVGRPRGAGGGVRRARGRAHVSAVVEAGVYRR
jgi:mannose-6-phosphate isomerase-like protein (cupin superfamily)